MLMNMKRRSQALRWGFRIVALLPLITIIRTEAFAPVMGSWKERLMEDLDVPSHLINLHEQFPVWGLDLSHHQATIDFETLIEEKPNFLIFKATEGCTHKDKQFKTNWKEAKKHDLVRGAYHFFCYGSKGKDQARYFIQNVKLQRGDLPPVLDLEYRRRMPKDANVIREIKAWLKDVEAHYKVKPIIYVGEVYYKRYLEGKISDEYPIWLCEYYKSPALDWTFWQITDQHRIDGVRGHVDKNVFYGDMEDLCALTMK